MLSEINQTENANTVGSLKREKSLEIFLELVESKKKKTKLIEKEIRLVVTRGGGWEEGDLEESGQKV